MASINPPYGSTGDSQASKSPSSGDSAGKPGQIADAAKAEAKAVWEETRASARSTLEQRQHEAAAGIGDLAGALRNSAQSLGTEHKDTVARIAERAADGLESLSDRLRSKDLDSTVREVEAFARRQPALFLGAAVAAGFLAMRFLKSSRQPASDEPHTQEAYRPPPYADGGQLH